MRDMPYRPMFARDVYFLPQTMPRLRFDAASVR